MKQLTVRVTEPEVRRRIEELAEREQLSLNQAVLKLLRRAVGLGADALENVPIGEDIQQFAHLNTQSASAVGIKGPEPLLRALLLVAKVAVARIDEDVWRPPQHESGAPRHSCQSRVRAGLASGALAEGVLARGVSATCESSPRAPRSRYLPHLSATPASPRG